MYIFHWETRFACGIQLAAGYDVETHIFFLYNPAKLQAAQSLACVESHSFCVIMVFEGLYIGAAGVSDGCFIDNINRRAVFLR